MAKNIKPNTTSLVIVESPAKVRSISKFLGRGYVVKACLGHVRDLPQRQYGVDVAHNFQPTYQVVKGRQRVINDLIAAARKADWVYLATDLDREGEAIAWHLVEALRLQPAKVQRVIFNEITETAIREAFAHPHQIDLDKVNAQQTRRILDRVVGYELSPLLWKKIAKGLSAGRVQSVAARLIVEREKEIRQFRPAEFWKFIGVFSGDAGSADRLARPWAKFLADADPEKGRPLREQFDWLGQHGCLRAELEEFGGRKLAVNTPEAARTVAEALGFAVERTETTDWPEYARLKLKRSRLLGSTVRAAAPQYAVEQVSTKATTSRPAPPFTTASLQQAAATQLGLSASKTMRLAQALYEGLEMGESEGPVGLITYMRTDSVHLSQEAVREARAWIGRQYGEQYVPERPNRYGSRQRAQEAHEAVRPTSVRRRPEDLRRYLNAQQLRLYELIWKRFVACQMAPAQWKSTSARIAADTAEGHAVLRATGRTLEFEGFLKVAGASTGNEQILPPLAVGQALGLLQIDPQQQFTTPPPRYTEASLVKSLESEGIGRPSTYATIIQTIQERGYVEQSDRRFHATALGEMVTAKLVAHFPRILDVKFTRHMEDQLDQIEEAHLDWVAVLHEFYNPFRVNLTQANEQMERVRAESSGQNCPECGKEMVYRWGKNGRFLSCSGYPNCKVTFNVGRDGGAVIPQPSSVACELCGKPMVLRNSRQGPFLGCSGYPQCRHTVDCDETGKPLPVVKEQDLHEPCEACGGTMVVKRRGSSAFLGCSNYPDCRHTKRIPRTVRLQRKAAPAESAGINCDRCGREMLIRVGRRGRFIACSGYPRCRNTKPVEKLEELRAAQASSGRPAGQPAAQAPTGTRKMAAKKQATKTEAKPVVKDGDGKTPAVSKTRLTRNGKLVVEKLDGPVPCPQCGQDMVVRRGPWGPFMSCSRFPSCKGTARLAGKALEEANAELGQPPQKPKPRPTDIACPACGAKMVIRTGRTGPFLGCGAFPKCRHTMPMPSQVVGNKNSS